MSENSFFEKLLKNKEVAVIAFFAVLLMIALLIPGISGIVAKNIVWIILIISFLLLATRTDFLLKLKEYERAVIFTFGRITRVGGPGWAIVLPIIESYKKVDLRVQAIDIPPQDVITKGNIELKVDSIIYLKIKKDRESVIKAVTEVENYKDAAMYYVISSMRALIGAMSLSEVISNVSKLNKKLTEMLDVIIDEWGLDVRAVEIKDITLPKQVQESMHNLRVSQQEKMARLEKAKALKGEIEAVKEAAKTLSPEALNYYYIKALEEMSKGKSTKFLFPAEFSYFVKELGKTIRKGKTKGVTSKIVSNKTN